MCRLAFACSPLDYDRGMTATEEIIARKKSSQRPAAGCTPPDFGEREVRACRCAHRIPIAGAIACSRKAPPAGLLCADHQQVMTPRGRAVLPAAELLLGDCVRRCVGLKPMLKPADEPKFARTRILYY